MYKYPYAHIYVCVYIHMRYNKLEKPQMMCQQVSETTAAAFCGVDIFRLGLTHSGKSRRRTVPVIELFWDRFNKLFYISNVVI